MSKPTVFVCGITGTQGSAVASALTPHAVPLRALVRDPSTPAAAQLASKFGDNLTTIHGDYDNEAALSDAMAGCNALFLNLSPDFTDPAAEARRAEALLAAARAAGVTHVIYSSGLSVNDPERLPHWDPKSFTAAVILSKAAIEDKVRRAGFPRWTILRPGNFMANYILPLVMMYPGLTTTGRWSTALLPDSILPMVDPVSIGAFVAAAVLDRPRFHEQEIEIADQMMTLEELMPKLSSAAGRELKAEYMTDEEVDAQKGVNPMVAAMLMMRDLSIFVDLAKVKSWGIPLSSFDTFLEREKERVLETYGNPA
ncbi:NAD dependent epimerase/dehydratase [Purpureocillium lavendulum]|uniref:NAD dependent epimerase/dehydratase n=1 Tax=Purpureocillium lavendulum TaxID=1247861 RepID=A0AB34G5Y6_9HYPO|nr:NAD dependent epimerase/dehydratase [Purpureocillium lavendulum]